MTENEAGISEKEQQRAKIRERYKGIDTDILEVIPAKKQVEFDDSIFRRVAVYVRVSTDNLQQTSSYELQKNYYEDKVAKNDNWTLVDIYADEGISGTSLNHREAFNRMIEDCKSGKIDMIITKSVSRFARNIVDCVSIVRMLSAQRNPVGVFFEADNIFSLKNDDEMRLCLMATLAQEESHTKSTIMNSSIEMRFSHGIVLTPVLIGYDHDEDGNLIINEEEARTVRLIFFMYLYGYTCKEIAEMLERLGRTTKKEKPSWSAGSILGILRNERYCGEVMTWKTFTTSYITHKSRKNKGDRTQHRWRNHHDAIISRDDFIAVQHLIKNAKYGNKGILPELTVVTEGALRGFILINPRWGGFTAQDYLMLSARTNGEPEVTPSDTLIEAKSGDFDFRGFEVARSQFFDTNSKICVTFSTEAIIFSVFCIRKLGNAADIEILFNPASKHLAVRLAAHGSRNSMQWAKFTSDNTFMPRQISGAAFLRTIYNLLGWDCRYRYRARGTREQKQNESMLIFDLNEIELFVPKTATGEPEQHDTGIAELESVNPILPNGGKSIIALPAQWADNFGIEYYRAAQARELAEMTRGKNWDLSEDSTSFSEIHGLNVTSRDVIENSIQSIIKNIPEDIHNEQ